MGNGKRVAVLAAVVFALATGCGHGDDNSGNKVPSLGGSSAPDNQGQPANNSGDGKSDDDRMREFAKCMRDHGVDMPDPVDGKLVARSTAGEDEGKSIRAHEACRHLMPNGGRPKPLSPEELDKKRQIAKCMREHGITMPDPSADGGTTMNLGDATPEQMEKAAKACGMEGGIAAVPGR